MSSFLESSSSAAAVSVHCCRYCYTDITASGIGSSSGSLIDQSNTLMGLVTLLCGCKYHYSCIAAYVKDSIADKSLIPYGGLQCPNKVDGIYIYVFHYLNIDIFWIIHIQKSIIEILNVWQIANLSLYIYIHTYIYIYIYILNGPMMGLCVG